MKAWLTAMVAIFMAMLQGESLIAQGIAAQPEFRKWDVAATIGLFGSSRRYFVQSDSFYNSYYNDPVTVAGNIDAGRYLTTHLKVDVGVMTTHSRRVYEYPAFSTGPLSSYSTVRVRPTTVSGAVTYQFFENVFAHPYVSAGLGLASISEERTVYSYTTSGLQAAVVSHDRYLRVRPFVAAGYKSYFNERAFMKSELLFAAASNGFSHATLRIGFGVDF
jgi:hypothetical protein